MIGQLYPVLLLASSSKDVWTDFTVSSKYLVDNHKPDGVNVPYESENSFLSNRKIIRKVLF